VGSAAKRVDQSVAEIADYLCRTVEEVRAKIDDVDVKIATPCVIE
jgi:hypothetical protein